MADAPVRLYALDAYAAAGDKHAPGAPGVPGVRIEARRVPAMLSLRGNGASQPFVRAVQEQFGVVLPVACNATAQSGNVRALWLGPDEWLLVSMDARAGEIDLSACGGTVTDLSHGRAVLRISGPATSDTLAKFCALDLDVRQFPVDTCAQTAIAKISVVLDRLTQHAFDMYCPRSYAGSLWQSMAEAGAEYGCEIVCAQSETSMEMTR